MALPNHPSAIGLARTHVCFLAWEGIDINRTWWWQEKTTKTKKKKKTTKTTKLQFDEFWLTSGISDSVHYPPPEFTVVCCWGLAATLVLYHSPIIQIYNNHFCCKMLAIDCTKREHGEERRGESSMVLG